MEELTLILIILSIVLFLGRYVLKKTGVDMLTMIVSVCAMAQTLKDTTIPEDDLLIMLIPTIFVMMITVCGLAFDKRRY